MLSMALVFVPNCDKVVPGVCYTAAARLNLPAIFVSGGPMLAGRSGDQGLTLTPGIRGVGAAAAGKTSPEELALLEDRACPTWVVLCGMFTANSMNCLTEALGIGFADGNGPIPPFIPERIRLAKTAGMKIMALVEKGISSAIVMTGSRF